MEAPSRDITQTTDAQQWAREFIETFNRVYPDNGIELDEGWLIGWFANAISTGDQFCYHNQSGRTWVDVPSGAGASLDSLRAQIGWYDEKERRRLVQWLADEFGDTPNTEPN